MFKNFNFLIFYVLCNSAWCISKKIICNNGETLDFDELCDGVSDCPDNMDEENKLCQHLLCPDDNFRCFYGACIDYNLKCDGKEDCADGSDESNCQNQYNNSCNVTEFKCQSGECIQLERICDSKPDCIDKSDEDEICKKANVCPSSTHRCKIGSCISTSQICDGKFDCIDGSDEKENVCSILHCNDTTSCAPKNFCSPVANERISAHCEVLSGPEMGVIPCHLPLPPHTRVMYECKPNYVPASPADFENDEMHCQIDGTWNRRPLTCKPECGLSDYDATVLIVNGFLTEQQKFPWHIVLYTLEEGKWIFTCGGTLISEKAVLTAGHCAWNIPKEMMQVALAKRYSDFYKLEPHAIFRNISSIFIQPVYQDYEGNYGSDIAILALKESVEFSPFIKPACIDWNLHDFTKNLRNNEMGIIAGMGLTENNTFSTQLRAISLPTVDNTKCINNQKRDFKKYITFTTFCAGWANGSGVCNGDSGGGLVFASAQNLNRYSIQGIVSVSPRRPGTSFCDPKYYTVFTKVGMYVHWIRDILQTLHQDKESTSDVVF